MTEPVLHRITAADQRDQQRSPLVFCFGEVLWDSLPQGLFPGGAPINVAYHLRQLGTRAVPITAVGRDTLGEELLRRIRWWNLETKFVSVLPDRPTGLVRVELNPGGIPSYDIVRDVAWDAIEVRKELLSVARESDALVFGSLAQRSKQNRERLQTLRANCGGLHVFDVNLRPPFDDRDLIWRLAERAGLIKLNDQEIERLLERKFGVAGLEDAARELSAKTSCPRVCVTAGANGAGLLNGSRWFWAEAQPIVVKDTIGAGDSFLAGLVHGLLTAPEGSEQKSLESACRLAEYVASCEGATPVHPRS